MNLLFFDSNPEAIETHGMLAAIRQALPDVEINVFTDLKRLSKWLQIPPRRFFAAIFILDTPKILTELFEFRAFFADRKLLISVTGNNDQSMNLAHQFNPHFIQWMQDDYTALIYILESWLATEKKSQQWIDNYTSSRDRHEEKR